MGLSQGASYLDGKSISGLLSPFLTSSFIVDSSLPDSHLISPSSPISSLLKISWCLPPPRFLISILSEGTMGFPLNVHSAGAVWSCSSMSKTSFSRSTATVSLSFLLKRFWSAKKKVGYYWCYKGWNIFRVWMKFGKDQWKYWRSQRIMVTIDKIQLSKYL